MIRLRGEGPLPTIKIRVWSMPKFTTTKSWGSSGIRRALSLFKRGLFVTILLVFRSIKERPLFSESATNKRERAASIDKVLGRRMIFGGVFFPVQARMEIQSMAIKIFFMGWLDSPTKTDYGNVPTTVSAFPSMIETLSVSR